MTIAKQFQQYRISAVELSAHWVHGQRELRLRCSITCWVAASSTNFDMYFRLLTGRKFPQRLHQEPVSFNNGLIRAFSHCIGKWPVEREREREREREIDQWCEHKNEYIDTLEEEFCGYWVQWSWIFAEVGNEFFNLVLRKRFKIA